MVVEYNQADITGGVTIYERLEAPKKAIIGFLIRHDIVDDEKQANIVLIGVILLCLVIIVFVVFHNGHRATGPIPTATQAQQLPVSLIRSQ